MIRTHDAGSLRAEHIGQQVTLAGWVARRRDHGGVAFIDLREASGVVQVVVREEVAHQLRAEYCLKIVGTVQKRPEGNENAGIPTGDIEVIADDVEILSAAAPAAVPDRRSRRRRRGGPPQVPLPRPAPRRPCRARSGCAARSTPQPARCSPAKDFVEIETPTLTRSTPEGARDFLVPARLKPGSWYALPQSPQLFKQLLMVGGMERYYQIARCYRDEDFRADRQPEFTQLDIEMSFVEQADVLDADGADPRQDVVAHRLRDPDADPAHDVRRGDAPVRLGQARPADGPGARRVHRLLQGHAVPGVPGRVRRRRRDARRRLAAPSAARRLAGVGQAARCTRPGVRRWSPRTASSVARSPRTCRDAERAGLAEHVGAKPGDCVFFGAGATKSTRGLLGAARLEIGERCGLIDESAWEFVWVVDAPLFEPSGDAVASGDVAVGAGAWTAVHHAFTSPQDFDTFDTDPGNALAWAYDIVCNGNELGGGSIRIHREDIQKRVFAIMGIERGRGAGEVRLPARRVQVRRAAARRHRLRHGPHLRHARRRRLDPRGHRVPQVRRRLRPADRAPRRRSRRSSARKPASTGSPSPRRPSPPRPDGSSLSVHLPD